MNRGIKIKTKVKPMGQECVCFNLRKAARVITQLYDEALKAVGLRATQLTVLAVIKALEPVTITRLARAAVMDRTTLTRNLKPLERQGLVQIEAGEDRRQRKVRLMERGHEMFNQAYPLWAKAQSQVIDKYGVEKFNHLIADLKELVARTR